MFATTTVMLQSFDEECSTTEVASTENGDMYLSCGSYQYTVGVEIIEDVAGQKTDSWQLLCCRSSSVRIRIGDCIDTKFINDYRRASSFSSSAQIIRRWQAMPENGDRRWWLQLCPVDVVLKKPRSISEIRAKRQLPWEWSRGRFPGGVQDYNPIFLEHLQQEEQRKRRLFDSLNRNSIFTGSHFAGNDIPTTTTPSYIGLDPELTETTVDLPKLTLPTRLAFKSRVQQFDDTKPIEALDYYDMYDENFDKKKHTEGGLLRGVSDFLQNIQDGLTLAQAAFPTDKNNNFQLRIAIPPHTSTTSPPKVMFSSDDDSLQIGPFVQQFEKKSGPMPSRPAFSTTPAPGPKQVDTITNMLQMIGLCQGHPEL
ncbi:dermatopontin domain-containing protein [Ditylenchus destructor]|uniref:Dermatopontin domain-containing protein n=1 Tax=Ditylenchus destructor TaxID=166010 RepID=A0AAD4NAI4_9BILA|nr:dermatopontin domain-containing protein [Ditylenchus destructor]